MVHTVDSLIADILRREGGYNNHKEDLGGATNQGISLRYARGIGLDLDGDGDVDEEDIKLVTPEVAAKLYREDFFFATGVYRLPDYIQGLAFDMVVNMGHRNGIGVIQKVCNLCLRAAPQFLDFDKLAVDGFVGNKTIKAVRACYKLMSSSFINAIVDERKDYYLDLINRRPEQEKFRNGWMNRAEEFRVK